EKQLWRSIKDGAQFLSTIPFAQILNDFSMRVRPNPPPGEKRQKFLEDAETDRANPDPPHFAAKERFNHSTTSVLNPGWSGSHRPMPWSPWLMVIKSHGTPAALSRAWKFSEWA